MSVVGTPSRSGPEPRSPLLRGVSDRLLGPGASPAETTLALGSGALAALLLPLPALRPDVPWSPVQVAVAAVLAFDLFGGVAVNASAPARRYYHRPGRNPSHHLGFVALHSVHVAVVAWLFRDSDWGYAAGVSAGLLACAALVVKSPPYLRRPVAMLSLAAALVMAPVAVPTAGLDWFVPVLFLKLLVCYLLGDLPPAPHRTGT